MLVKVLGATEVWRGDERVDLGTRKRRALVAALALAGGRPVSVDRLIDQLWADTPPDGVSGTLQVYVSGLRRALEPDRAPRAQAQVLVTVSPGYALRMPSEGSDVARFERTVTEVHRALGGTGGLPHLTDGLDHLRLEELAEDLDGALDLWRGVPYVELDEAGIAIAERARLEELRLVALEDRARLGLALGRHATVAAELDALTAAHPLRERLWGLRARALAGSGRQADALSVLATVRTLLDEELGLEPSAELRELQTAILRQDPAVTGPAERPHPAEAAPEPTAPGRVPWPMVGREAELEALVGLLKTADGGVPSYAVLTGDPGIGKSRLCAELAGVAQRLPARTLVGRCSQDEEATPLGPWRQVLGGLGAELPVAADADEGAEFRTWEAIVDRVLDTSLAETLLVALDDLHWADPPTLRVLRLLAERAERGRLAVVATWRSHPEPSAALADVAEVLARRHARRLALTGLRADQGGDVVEAVTRARPTPDQAARLVERTDGNPFFLVEYARLATDAGPEGDATAGLSALLDERRPPQAVGEVLGRRVGRLPEASRTLLRSASVIGRGFDLATLTGATGLGEDQILDGLDPAVDAGLVQEEGVGGFRFAHALVRDALYDAQGATRRARTHAKVAETLAGMPGRPGREAEVSRHWREAGPGHAGRAWRAARAAARSASRVHGYGLAADELTAGLRSLELDPEASDRDRYDTLMELAEMHRWRGDWVSLLTVATGAIESATRLGDVRALAEAGSAMTKGALWQSPGHGEEHPVVLAALRRALAELPEEDDELRCRVMLALGAELYYVAPFAEREALVTEATSMARRIGDERLLLHVCEVAFVALWRPDTTRRRLAMVLEGRQIAERIGHERSYAVASTLAAVAYGELGRPAEMWAMVRAARDETERLRLPYAALVLDGLVIPWLGMAGEFEAAGAALERMLALTTQTALPQVKEGIGGALVSLHTWQGRLREVASVMMDMRDGPLPVAGPTVVMLARAGDEQAARAHAAAYPIDLTGDDWFSMLNWCLAGEVALLLGDADLAADAYARMAPYAGYTCCAGSGSNLGPVDAFLAQAAAARGDLTLASHHADDAERLLADWGLPVAAAWFADVRAKHAF